jgi:putative nucleotidyltransferase with HDIG domain
MVQQRRSGLAARTQTYVLVVGVLGSLVIWHSALELLDQPVAKHKDWLLLAALTFVSGWLSVKLPTVSAVISISETFVIAGTLLFGPAVGTVLVVLDALVLCSKDTWRKRDINWQKVAFNLSAPPLSIWIAGRLARVSPVSPSVSLNLEFAVMLASFTALYFLLNSWLVTFAVSLEQRLRPLAIWRASFTEVFINYAAGASIAAFLVVNAQRVDLAFIGVIVPLLLVIYFTYHWSGKRVEAEREKVQELNRVFLSTVEALALAIDAKDQVTHGHIRRVQRYTMALASAVGVKDEKQLDAIRAAALLHDTGKLAVPEYILNKPGPLTAAEFEKMKVHADVGADILKSIDFPYPVEPIVRHHHEQWDGSGYPKGLAGQEIPLGARILSVVDCYDALTSDRPYRPRMTRQQAEGVLKERRGRAYDPWIVDQFLTILDQLEEMEAAQQRAFGDGAAALNQVISPIQLEAISATNAEEREFAELRRELARTSSLIAATEVTFKHLRRIVPVSTVALSVPKPGTDELVVMACFGVGEAVIRDSGTPVGERVSGWAFAHSQVVINSDAALELGPVARTFSPPLRYAAALPLLDGNVTAVLMCYASVPFQKDHRRLLENAAALFAASSAQPQSRGDSAQSTGPAVQTHPRVLIH